jgi:two-component system, cell cycle sensor histidine kinase and response regulator CckA
VLADDGTLLYASGSASDQLGHSPGNFLGRPATVLLHPDDVRRFARIARRVVRRPGSQRRGVGRLRHDDGSWRSHEITLTAACTGSTTELIVCARDLSTLESLERQLHRAQALQVVGQATASLVHDFNNLIVLIRCGADMALHRLPPDSEARRDVESVVAAGGDAARLAGQILQFACGAAPCEGPARVNEVIGATLPMLVRALGSAGIRVETSLHPSVGSVAMGQTQIQQVLVNLALNARDAMPHGGVFSIFTDRIEVETPVLPPFPSTLHPGPHLRIELSDTGEGMDEHTRMHVFDPFFTTRSNGTGLGLHTIRAMLQRYEGWIWVESRRGAGSTFTVLLPEHAAASGLHPAAGDHPAFAPAGLPAFPAGVRSRAAGGVRE